MSLKEIVEPLIKGGGESMVRYNRAVKLFEFQISLFYRNSFEHLSAGKIDQRLTRAKLRAAIRFLQKLESDLNQPHNRVISIQDLAGNQDYQSIYDNLFVPNGGWSKVLHSMQVGEFDEAIKERRNSAQTAANIIDFSYRFSENPPNINYGKRKNPGGVEAAKYVVRNACKPACGESTIKGVWGSYRSTAIFLYLMLSQKNFDLQPPPLNSKKFADRLLRQADNVDEIRKYFRGYQIVQLALSHLKYEFPILDLDLGASPLQLHAPEFSTEMARWFSAWVQRG